MKPELLTCISSNKTFNIQLWRHATLLVSVGPYRFLIDPMLSAKEAMEPVQNAGNEIRIPMVELPFSEEQVQKAIQGIDAIIITHTHRDHWDTEAMRLISKDKLIICPDFEKGKLGQQGFTNVMSIAETSFPQLELFQIGGRHGTGEIGKAMGQVAGIIFRYQDQTLYLAGDTIYCQEVKLAIDQYAPKVIIANAGGARFLTGDPITMDEKDIEALLQSSGEARILAVHMDTINHCVVTRDKLIKYFVGHPQQHRLIIPADGNCVKF